MLLTVEGFRYSQNNLNGNLGKVSEMYLISDSESPLRGIYPKEINICNKSKKELWLRT